MPETALQSARLNSYWSAVQRYVGPGPAHFFMYTAGRFHSVRQLALLYFRLKRRNCASKSPEGTASVLEDLNIEAVATDLRRDGFSAGLRLRPENLAELREFCANSHCFGNGKRTRGFLLAEKLEAEKSYGDRFSTGRYLNCASTCSAIEKIVRDKNLLGIARSYLGVEPILVGARCWWSFASDSEPHKRTSDGQSYHYDLDDYRAVCFFFYLTDVDDESGPHICVLKSHRRKPLRYLLSPFKTRTDKDIQTRYKPEQIISVKGNAGQGFAEDLFCYHKGSHPKSKDRLILQVRFRLQDFGGLPVDGE